ncbi:hypothetical protein TKK_0008101 [Trichogramma kaykai]
MEPHLNTLQQLNKWQGRRETINVGDIILIINQSLLLSSGRWPIGCVTHTYVGPDEQVRVAQVRTASGSYKRPVVKLVALPVKTSSSDPDSLTTVLGGRDPKFISFKEQVQPPEHKLQGGKEVHNAYYPKHSHITKLNTTSPQTQLTLDNGPTYALTLSYTSQ